MQTRPSFLKIWLPILLAFWLAAPDLSAQAPGRQLTLEQAINIALEQSPDALIARQTFQTSYWQYRSFRADYLPSLKFSSFLPNIYRSITSELDSGVKRYYYQQYINSSAALDLSQKIGLTGGVIRVRSGLEGTYNYNNPNPRVYVGTPVDISLVQPIFQYNPYRWQKKIEPLNYTKAKRKYVEDREAIRVNTANVFFALLEAQIEKKIQMKNLANNDTLYRIAQGRYELGKIAENDKLQLELNFLNAQAAVENADLALDNALFRFKSYLRLQDTARLLLVPPDNITFFSIEPGRAVSIAKENSTQVLDFERRLLEAASSVNQAKLTGRFDANLEASYGLQKSDVTIPDAYKDFDDSQTLTLSLTIPIVDWGVARGQIKMAQSQEEIVRNQVEQDRIDFERNIYLKAIQFNMQRNQLAIAAKADTVARKSFEVIKGRYMIGKINDILQLNNAQIQTDRSEKEYYNALQIYWVSYYEIRRSTLYDFSKDRALVFDLENFR